MIKQRIPMRMCIACRNRHPKADLLRLVTKEQTLALDLSGHWQGRGAYLCRDLACLNKAMRSKCFERSLHMGMNEDLLRKIEEEI